MKHKLVIYLDFPPTVNSYYLKGRILSKKGRQYSGKVLEDCVEQGAILGLDTKLNVSVILYPPDRRTRDLDNYMKALQDSLTKAGVWEDDKLIDQLSLYRGVVIPRAGKVVVVIQDAGPVLPNNSLALSLVS